MPTLSNLHFRDNENQTVLESNNGAAAVSGAAEPLTGVTSVMTTVVSNRNMRIHSRLDNELIEEYRMISGFESAEIIRLEREFLKLTHNSDFMTRAVFQRIPAIEVCPLADRLEMVFFEQSTVLPDAEDRAGSVAAWAGLNGDSAASGSFVLSNFSDWVSSWFQIFGHTGTGSDDSAAAVAATGNGISGSGKPDEDNSITAAVVTAVNASNCHDLLSFRDFLLGLSLFNSPGMSETKLKLSFRLQDFDGDGVLSREDLIEYICRITGYKSNTVEAEAEAEVEKEQEEAGQEGEEEVVNLQQINGNSDANAVVSVTTFNVAPAPASTSADSALSPPPQPPSPPPPLPTTTTTVSAAAANSGRQTATTVTVPGLTLTLDDIEEIVDQLFLECVDMSNNNNNNSGKQGVVLADYLRIVALSEFATKLRITI